MRHTFVFTEETIKNLDKNISEKNYTIHNQTTTPFPQNQNTVVCPEQEALTTSNQRGNLRVQVQPVAGDVDGHRELEEEHVFRVEVAKCYQ